MFQTVENSTNPSNETNHRKASCVRLQHWPRLPSALTLERTIFLLLHCLVCIILFILIYIRLEHVNHKQDLLMNIFRHKTNQTQPIPIETTSSTPIGNCSCSTGISPRRNRTTRCLQISVGSNTIENVFCPFNGKWDNRAWLIIQQRQSNSVSFNRTWNEYKRGFGNVTKQIDFWIGNENLHWLTNVYLCRLKIELTDWYNETRTATYETFQIASPLDGYRIYLNNYHGDIEVSNKIDSFSQRHNNARFSTYDHFATTKNCSALFGGGGWWYHSGDECAHVQLNGQIATHSDGLVPYNTGVLWTGWKPDRHYSFQRVVMSIQPKSRRSRPKSSSSS